MKRLVQIVPHFAPTIDGVGDFARQLGEELEERFAVENVVLVTSPTGGGDHDSKVRNLSEESANGLYATLEACEPDVLLLHYSGYGYDRRGLPEWLVHGLENFAAGSNARTAVFFHEVWASGPLWKREFYSQFAQKRLTHRLSSMADALFTSTPKMKRLLGRTDCAVVPIPSAVPPVAAVRPKDPAGSIRLAVFGQEHTRARTLQCHEALLATLATNGDLNSISLIGKGADNREVKKSIADRTAVTAHPNASPEEIAERLEGADACLSFYPAELITKSSSAMAAFSCGCPVILPFSDKVKAESANRLFTPHPPFLVCDGSARGIQELLQARADGSWNTVANRAHAWQRDHANWKKTAARIAEMIQLDRAMSQQEMVAP